MLTKNNLTDCLNFQNEILPKVSRSFALTIPELPNPLNLQVANAYLLCRITDTIEDDPELSHASKQQLHYDWLAVLSQKYPLDEFQKFFINKISKKTPKDEQLLIENLNKVIYITYQQPKPVQKILIKCVQTMSQGMNKFSNIASHKGLKNLKQLNKYCYYVAGVVGEMLTDLFCVYCPKLQSNKNKLIQMAIDFGQALQMTNILKDIWDDRARKICWLPQSLFKNFYLENLSTQNVTEDYITGLNKLINIAKQHLNQAVQFTLNLPKNEKGLRVFCLWAIAPAFATLNNIAAKPNFTNSNQIKVKRYKMRRLLIITKLIAGSNFLLRSWFKFQKAKI